MSQKSNHYFVHDIISVIVQRLNDMKFIYFPYGACKAGQEYKC